MIQCKKCQTNNRDEAKYCKKCGNALDSLESMKYGDFYSKDHLFPLLDNFESRVLVASNKLKPFNLNCIVYGDAGTGKTFITNKLRDILQDADLIKQVSCVDAADYNTWLDRIDDNLAALGAKGLLIIDDAHKLLPSDVAKDLNDLDKLFSRMKKKSSNFPIVFLSGSRIGLQPFLEKNPEIAALFGFIFETKPMSSKDLVNICSGILEDTYETGISTNAVEKLEKRFEFLKRKSDSSRGGHLAEGVAEDCYTNASGRRSKVIEEVDIQGDLFIPPTEDEIWNQLDVFIGLDNVKEEIRKIVDGIKDARRNGKQMTISDHYVFSGNPGTGKTTIARIFASILSNLGVLPQGHLIEVAGKDLIDQYIGGSERKVQEAVDSAMGGILFIDEAYGLNDGQFGKAAIDKLLPIVENNRGKFICIIAGYSKEMRDFMNANSGLKSRFNKEIFFPDYNAKELELIFRKLVEKDGFLLTPEADRQLQFEMQKMYDRKSDNFGNARDVRNYFKEAVERRLSRIRTMTEADIQAEGKLLTLSDIAGENATQQVSLDDIMSELNNLIGLTSVKKEITALVAHVNRLKILADHGEGSKPIINHYLFLGNPGTGKTTVARLMGKILHSLGLISRDDVCEVKREDLVAPYLGQTAPKTKKVVKDAMGGILFIDEAYNLINGENDSFGKECIDTLVPLLEDNRGKFVCICAGYTKDMEELLRANAGLSSRLTERIVFEDYSTDELFLIFESLCKKKKLIIGDGVETRVREKLEVLKQEQGIHFGNAREVRNLLDSIDKALSSRVMVIPDRSYTQLKTIEKEDVAL